MWPFKCQHPLAELTVTKEHTDEVIDNDFSQVRYYFYCDKCNTNLIKTHARLRHGVAAFLKIKEGME